MLFCYWFSIIVQYYIFDLFWIFIVREIKLDPWQRTGICTSLDKTTIMDGVVLHNLCQIKRYKKNKALIPDVGRV
jgi:hypothetical protein